VAPYEHAASACSCGSLYEHAPSACCCGSLWAVGSQPSAAACDRLQWPKVSAGCLKRRPGGWAEGLSRGTAKDPQPSSAAWAGLQPVVTGCRCKWQTDDVGCRSRGEFKPGPCAAGACDRLQAIVVTGCMCLHQTTDTNRPRSRSYLSVQCCEMKGGLQSAWGTTCLHALSATPAQHVDGCAQVGRP